MTYTLPSIAAIVPARATEQGVIVGLLKRLFGGAASAPVSTTRVPGRSPESARVAGERVIIPPVDGRRQAVVGTDFHASANRSLKPGGARFEFRREPQNSYDPHAVAVHYGGRRIGYLSAFMAEDYYTAFDRLLTEGPCYTHGTVEDHGHELFPVVHLPQPDRLAAWAATEPAERPLIPLTYRYVRLKRLGPLQDNLATILKSTEERVINAELVSHVTLTGKYKGNPYLKAVAAGGTDVGSLPAQYRHEAPDLFDTVGPGVVLPIRVQVKRWSPHEPIAASIVRLQ